MLLNIIIFLGIHVYMKFFVKYIDINLLFYKNNK